LTESATTIPDNSQASTVTAWIVAVIVCAVSVPLFWALPPEVAKGNRMALFALLFPLGGIGLVVYAIRLTLAQWRYGRLSLAPDPDPGMVGGVMGGRIALPLRLSDERDALLTLTCLRTSLIERRNGESNSTERSESIVWQREGQPVVQQDARGSLLLFRFDIARDLPPGSDDASVDGAHRWVLSLEIARPGVSLHRKFDVKVAPDGTVPSAQIAALPEASRRQSPA
jgi:hypothetical protein